MSAAKKSEAEARVKALYYIMQSAEARHLHVQYADMPRSEHCRLGGTAGD